MTTARALAAASASRSFPEAGARPRFAPDRTCVVAALDIGLRLDPSQPGSFHGDTWVTLAPLPSGQLDARLDLEDVVVNDVTDEAGQVLPHRHTNGVLRIQGVPATGGRVRVRYQGSPTRGLYFTGPTEFAPDRPHMAWTQCQDEDGHHLFPCHDHPGRRCPVRLRITVPEGNEVVANGALEDMASADGWTTWTWNEARSIPAYLVVVAVGPMEVVEASADNAGQPLPVRYLTPRGVDHAVIQRVFGRTPAMISAFARRFGVPYPWPRYDQVVVHDFIFGGMENAAATVLTDLALTDDRAHLDYSADDLIAHELAHQWFGDLVTCQDWSQAWLNEGWATYSEVLWKEAGESRDEADYHLWGKLVGYLGEDGGRYRRSIVHFEYRNPIDLFDRHLYEKGGLVLHTLRHHLGEDAFWAGVRGYLEDHGFSAVHTRDFQQAMEHASGRNLDRFFQEYILGAGHPTLEVGASAADGLLTVTVKQTQSGDQVANAFGFTLPIEVVIEGAAEPLRVALPVSERERSFTLPVSGEVERVSVDPTFTVLADLTLTSSRALLQASLTHDPGVIGRIRAARALGKDRSAPASRALAAALQQEAFWGVRAVVAEQLGKRGGDIAREALLGALDDPHPKARRAVVRALGKVRHEQVTAALTRLATPHGDPSLFVVADAARALGGLRAAAAVERCRALVAAPSWGDVLAQGGLDGLGATREAAVLADLLAQTQADRSPLRRGAAVRALGQLAQEVDAVRRPAVDRLMELAQDGPFRVRLFAIKALGQAGDPRAASVLTAIHAGDPDGRTARTAYEARAALRSADQSGVAKGASLSSDLDALRDENRALRTRIEALEGRLGS